MYSGSKTIKCLDCHAWLSSIIFFLVVQLRKVWLLTYQDLWPGRSDQTIGTLVKPSCWLQTPVLMLFEMSRYNTGRLLSKQLSVWLVQLVKLLAAPTHVNACGMCAEDLGLIPGAEKLDSSFYPSWVGQMRSNQYIVSDRYRRLQWLQRVLWILLKTLWNVIHL